MFTTQNLNIIDQGAASQDVLTSPKFISSPQNHCDENLVSQCHSYFEERFDTAVGLSKDAFKYDNPEDPNSPLYQTLFTLGEGFHTLQDFYSHSNYLEYLITNNQPLEKFNWSVIPPWLRTGYFYYISKPVNETQVMIKHSGIPGQDSPDTWADARDEIIRILNTGKTFQPRDVFKNRWTSNNDYKIALAYALSPNTYLHWELNKDDELQPEGRIVVPGFGRLTDLAQQLAAKDTTYFWGVFEDKVCQQNPIRCAWILPAVRGDRKFPKIKMTFQPSPEVEPEKTITGTLTVNLQDVEKKSIQNVRLFMTLKPALKISGEKKLFFNGPANDTGIYQISLETDLPLEAPKEEGKITVEVSANYEDDPTVDPGQMRFYRESAELKVGKKKADKSIVLLIDTSGSMNDNGKIAQARNAAIQAIRKMGGATEIAVLSFSGGCSSPVGEVHYFSDNVKSLEESISNISAGGGTPLVPAIQYATQYIQKNAEGKTAEIILLCDGQNDCGTVSDATAAVRSSTIPVTVNTIGFDIPKNSQADQDLQTISNGTGGRSYNAQDAKQLNKAFSRTMMMNTLKGSDSPSMQSYFDRAKSSLQGEDFSGALTQYQQAYGATPNSPAVNFNLSIVYEELDQLNPAIDHAQKYLNLAPNAFDRSAVTSRIDNMKQELARNPRQMLDPASCKDVYLWAKSEQETAKKSKNPSRQALLFSILIAAQGGDCNTARTDQAKYRVQYP